MKNLLRHHNLWVALLFGLLLPLGSCDDDDDDDMDPVLNIVQFEEITITGDQEVPANESEATGTFDGSYNKDTNVLTYTITYQGITPTAMHFHKGAAGVSGGVEVPIGSAPYTSPIVGQTPAITEAQEADLLAGLWYVNIHSAALPAGEIRGQVVQ
ncbi:hypothetical protein GCM10023188_04530 [Pontibacter saemangeumensis]|uniref:CHRD domain-containing protein n=1 Tax=Pontibacter saemangeumensis TaxID=1084525 RepID=A0ABP8L8V5_9BACT